MKLIFVSLYFSSIFFYLLLLFSFIRGMERIGKIMEKKAKGKERKRKK